MTIQVEKVFGASHPDSMEIEKAKKVLRVKIKTENFHFFFPSLGNDFILGYVTFVVYNRRTMNKLFLMP